MFINPYIKHNWHSKNSQKLRVLILDHFSNALVTSRFPFPKKNLKKNPTFKGFFFRCQVTNVQIPALEHSSHAPCALQWANLCLSSLHSWGHHDFGHVGRRKILKMTCLRILEYGGWSNRNLPGPSSLGAQQKWFRCTDLSTHHPLGCQFSTPF